MNAIKVYTILLIAFFTFNCLGSEGHLILPHSKQGKEITNVGPTIDSNHNLRGIIQPYDLIEEVKNNEDLKEDEIFTETSISASSRFQLNYRNGRDTPVIEFVAEQLVPPPEFLFVSTSVPFN